MRKMGDDLAGRGNGPATPGIRYPGQDMYIRNAEAFLRSRQQQGRTFLRAGGSRAPG